MTFGKLKGDHAGAELQVIAIRQHSLCNWLPVHLCAVGTLEIVQDEISAIVSDSGMMPRHLTVIQPQIATDTSTDHHIQRGRDFVPAAAVGTVDHEKCGSKHRCDSVKFVGNRLRQVFKGRR